MIYLARIFKSYNGTYSVEFPDTDIMGVGYKSVEEAHSGATETLNNYLRNVLVHGSVPQLQLHLPNRVNLPRGTYYMIHVDPVLYLSMFFNFARGSFTSMARDLGLSDDTVTQLCDPSKLGTMTVSDMLKALETFRFSFTFTDSDYATESFVVD